MPAIAISSASVTCSWSTNFMSQFSGRVNSWLKPFDTTYINFGIGLRVVTGRIQIDAIYVK